MPRFMSRLVGLVMLLAVLASPMLARGTVVVAQDAATPCPAPTEEEATAFATAYFNAWNAQTGSLSFGYDGVSDQLVETRKVVIANLGSSPKTYSLSSAFRYSDDVGKGASIAIRS